MQKLIQGIHQFRTEDFRPLQGLFEQLAKGQSPETLFITCSDLHGLKPGSRLVSYPPAQS